MKTSDMGLSLIKEFEGCELRAYRDVAGVLTVGVGHVGSDVYEGMEITPEAADALLREDLTHAERCVNRVLGGLQVTQGQFDALVSLCFNVGCGALSGSTLLKRLLEGDDAGAAAQFERWNKAGGKVVPGLVRRRRAERELFET